MARWTRALVALLLVVAAACSDSDDDRDGGAPSDPERPPVAITSVDVTANPRITIAAELTVELDAPAAVTVTVAGPSGETTIPATDESATHRIPVVGMWPESEYAITVAAGEAEETVSFTTGALPDDLPPIELATAAPDRMSPGVTVFNAFSWDPVPEGSPPPDAGYMIAVDDQGKVVWYSRTTHQILDIDTTPRGTFIVTGGDALLQEIDLFGTVAKEWGTRIATGVPGKDLQGRPLSDDRTFPIDIDSSHHEVTELPNGNIITLSTEVIELDEADARRLCPDNPEATVVGDIVVELTPDGAVVQEWPLSDVYDPAETPGSEMCIVGPPVAPPNWFYPESGATRDWTHANAVEVYEDENLMLVSSRHLDEIMALRYHDDDEGKAGELLWSLGTQGTLALDGEPPRHQHAMELGEDGVSLLLYDNGNLRPGTAVGGGTAPPYSRAVIYELDVDAGTARQVWDHRDTWADGRTIFTPFLGDVDMEPNGNVLITHGGGSTAGGVFQAKIVEVVRGDAADGSGDEVVFDIVVGDGRPGAVPGPHGWSVYRAVRLPSLYFARS